MTLRDKLKNNETGSFGTIAALTLGIVILCVGAAFDVAGSVNEKQKLQDSIDAALLASARSQDLNKNEIKTMITELIQSELGEDTQVTVKINDDVIEVSANSQYETTLLGLFGKNTLDVGTGASVPRGSAPPIDIALVVDTTFSMQGANMTALRSAASELIDDLEDTDTNVRVALVPYGNYVNIGPDSYPWLDNVKASEIIDHGPQSYRPSICTPTGTTTSRPQYSDGVLTHYQDVADQHCEPDMSQPEVITDPPPYTRTFEYEGCVGSRYTTNGNVTPGADSSDPIKAAMEAINDGVRQNWVECGTEIIPLTDDYAKVRMAINGLTTSGNTYIPAGLIWGWRTLDPQTPYTEAASGVAAGHNRAIIFMTDGGNVMAQDWAYHQNKGDQGAAGLAVAKQICSNIKDDGIRIFTVGYDIGDISGFSEDPQIMLNQCASSSGDSFTANNAYELKQAFKSIGSSLSEVRLSR